MNKPKLAIIIPCFNEEQVLPETLREISEILRSLIKKNKISSDSLLLFVDDGSTDRTWELIKGYSLDNSVEGLKLSRNFGHQQALLAGMLHISNRCDCLISVDADLQDDPSVIEQFIDKHIEGNEIVYGVRSNRDKDSFFKKHSARNFYKLLKFLGVEIIPDHADYRLIGKKALSHLKDYDEVNLFLRGIIPLFGFKSNTVYYKRQKRFAGESKYPFFKMVSFALDAVTSFSIKPLRLITAIGAMIFMISLIASVWVLIEISVGKTIRGWASTVLPIYFIGGIQLFSLGIIGEYIGRIYREVKHRPKFIIEESTE